MLKYCVDMWEAGKADLRKVIEKQFAEDKYIEYEWLMEQIVKNCLNKDDEYNWNAESITVINDGNYQGTLLFLIPCDCYQPAEYEYLMTWVGYGSCSGCDALQRAIHDDSIDDIMTICLHLIQNMIHPYSCTWREEDKLNEECQNA